MPLGNPLPAGERDLILRWIRKSAPLLHSDGDGAQARRRLTDVHDHVIREAMRG